MTEATEAGPSVRRIAVPTARRQSRPAQASPSRHGSTSAHTGSRTDRTALLSAQLAGALGLIAGVLTIVGLLVPTAASSTVVGKGIGSSSNSSLGGVTFVFGLGFGWYAEVAAASFLVAELSLFVLGFRVLSRLTEGFAAPAMVALVGVAGGVLLLAGWLDAAGAGFIGVHQGDFELVSAGAVLAIAGSVGVALGVWRLGKRYRRELLKVAGALLVLPVISLVGDVLLILVTLQERRRERPGLRNAA